MTQEISSLMDGELETGEAERAIRSCCSNDDLKKDWYLYHAIGDVMRGQAPRKLQLPDDVFENLKTQPTVLAPRRPMQTTVARIALAAAASVATVGVVGWIGSQGGTGTSLPAVAKSSSPIQPVANKAPAAAPAFNVDVQDYLAAHRQMPSPDSVRAVNNRATAAAR
jgi:sigma-E factor negative regulatory protein RseA